MIQIPFEDLVFRGWTLGLSDRGRGRDHGPCLRIDVLGSDPSSSHNLGIPIQVT